MAVGTLPIKKRQGTHVRYC